MLNILAEKAIHQPASLDGLLAYCPTMDLLALATKEEQVFVYRLNGQRVFSAAQKGPSRVEKLRWKPNGWYLLFSPDFSGQLTDTIHRPATRCYLE
jgi:anaphase-promoting complex subunit 4